MSRHIINGLIGAASVLFALVLLRFVWSPDPVQSLFAKAQRLEASKQIDLALRHYQIISDTHPESFYAPRALMRQGDLLAERGIQEANVDDLQRSVAAYANLAYKYPADPLSSEALLDAGKIAAENLRDHAAAKGFYNQLLDKSGGKSDNAATATVKLGRLALDEGDKKTAQTLLQRVLRQWPNLSDRAAEAQFYLGVTYETLFKNKEWANRAYDATIARYPNSTWANDARGRLGLSVYSAMRGQRPARRVLIETEPLPDEGNNEGSLWDALRPLLAAYGVESDSSTLRLWSLAPFYAGFDPQNPSHVVDGGFDGFENVLANAGLRFTVKSGGDATQALRDLQDEIDAARAPLVYFEEKGTQNWALCVGYDSDRGEVMLQSRGARIETLNIKSFAAAWKANSSLGRSYTMLSVIPSKTTARPKPNLTPTSAPTPAPGQTPAPQLLTVPAFVWQLPQLSRNTTDHRTLQRGATWLERPKNGSVWLGAEALSVLATQLNQISRSPASSPVPQAEAATPEPTGLAGDESSPYAPDATPTSQPAPRDDAPRARALLGFFGAPARDFAAKRREIAAWCDGAANRLNDSNLTRAAQNLRLCADALEEASMLAPSSVNQPLGVGDRTQLAEVAHQVERARDAEREAAKFMR